MSRKVRDQKLDSLTRCLKRIEDNIPSSLDLLMTDVNLQDILILNLERLVQMSVDAGIAVLVERGELPLPDSMAGVFKRLEMLSIIDKTMCEAMSKSVGFRNICVHEYDKIDWLIVFDVVTKHLATFKRFAGVIDSI